MAFGVPLALEEESMRSVKSTGRTVLAGLVAAVFVAACGSTTPTPGAVDVGKGALTGAGSTFDNPLFSRAFFDYTSKYHQVTVNYQAVGSGAGIQQFI